jgi:orotidine-5'-phosphate decarboxylase
MGPADLVVILVYGRVLGGFQHSDDFRLSRELEEIVVVPGIRSEGRVVALEELDLAVDGKHLLDKGSPEVEES